MLINKLITENIVFADSQAALFKKKLPFVNYDEFQSAAYLGLVEAANSFDPDRNVSFRSFAYARIVGAMKDYLREISWGSRRFAFTAIPLPLEA